jgi:hypothetical protein
MAKALPIEMQEITWRLITELRPKVDAVRSNRGMDQGRQTGAGPAETVPGRAARAGKSERSRVRDRWGGKDPFVYSWQRDATRRAAELGRCWRSRINRSSLRATPVYSVLSLSSLPLRAAGGHCILLLIIVRSFLAPKKAKWGVKAISVKSQLS